MNLSATGFHHGDVHAPRITDPKLVQAITKLAVKNIPNSNKLIEKHFENPKIQDDIKVPRMQDLDMHPWFFPHESMQ